MEFEDPDISLDKCFFLVEKKRHTRVDELMLKKGLSRGQPHILFALHRNNGCTQKELSETLIIRPASVTAALQKMEQSGYVERTADKTDLRVMRVCLTDKGSEFLEECKTVFDQMERECFGNFTQEEKTEFRRLLIKVSDNLG